MFVCFVCLLLLLLCVNQDLVARLALLFSARIFPARTRCLFFSLPIFLLVVIIVHSPSSCHHDPNRPSQRSTCRDKGKNRDGQTEGGHCRFFVLFLVLLFLLSHLLHFPARREVDHDDGPFVTLRRLFVSISV